MMRSKLMWSAMLGCALMLGCDSDTETPSGTDATNSQATEEASDTMQAKTEDASERAKDSAEEVDGAMKDKAEEASDALKSNADAAADAANADPAAAAATAQVTSVMDMIRDNKLEAAETALKALETNKASLPATTQAQVDNARKMLDAAKAGGGTTPAVPDATVTPAAPAAP